MAGLVAIVAHDSSSRVTDAELDQFVAAYESVRGVGTRLTGTAGTRARVAVILSGGGRGELREEGGSWAAFVGNPVWRGSLPSAQLAELDGQFALVSYDEQAVEVRVASDPFAMQTVFVAERDSRTYVSTSVLALAKLLRAKPDRFGLEVFLRAGYHYGRLTSWAGIERLEPATCLSIRDGSRQRAVYWRPSIDRNVWRLDLAAAATHCADIATEAIRTAFGEQHRPWMDLTGGFDSRLLALLLERAGVEFACNTRGDADDADRRIARRLAAARGWELFDPTLPPNWEETLREMLAPAVAWGDGNLQALELAWVLWVHRRMGERGGHLLSGGGGEHWRGFAWSQEFLQAGRSNRVNMDNWIDMRLLHPMSLSVFARDPTPGVREDSRRRMLEWASPYADEPNTVQLDMMYAYKMTGHFGAYRSADDFALSAALPFYLKRVFTAAVSVHHRHRASHRLMRRVISQLDPVLAAVATATGGPATPWRPAVTHRFLPYYARIGRRAVTKVAQTTIGRPLFASPVVSWWAPHPAQLAAVRVLGATPEERRRELRSSALYDGAALEAFLGDVVAGRVHDAQLLGRIVTAELALRQVDAAVDG